MNTISNKSYNYNIKRTLFIITLVISMIALCSNIFSYNNFEDIFNQSNATRVVINTKKIYIDGSVENNSLEYNIDKNSKVVKMDVSNETGMHNLYYDLSSEGEIIRYVYSNDGSYILSESNDVDPNLSTLINLLNIDAFADRKVPESYSSLSNRNKLVSENYFSKNTTKKIISDSALKMKNLDTLEEKVNLLNKVNEETRTVSIEKYNKTDNIVKATIDVTGLEKMSYYLDTNENKKEPISVVHYIDYYYDNISLKLPPV